MKRHKKQQKKHEFKIMAMEDFNQRLTDALKYGQELERDEREKERNKNTAEILRCILEKEYKDRKGFDKLAFLEANFKRWKKDPKAFQCSKTMQYDFRLYELMKEFEQCSK